MVKRRIPGSIRKQIVINEQSELGGRKPSLEAR